MTRRLFLILGLAFATACNKGLQPRPILQPAPGATDSTHAPHR